MEFAFAPDKYSAAVYNFTKIIVSLEFKAVGKDDVSLTRMASYLSSGGQINEVSKNPICPWYKKDDVKKYLTLKINQFSQFARANTGNEDMNFIITDTSENQAPCKKAVALVPYVMGHCDMEDFEPPSPPSKPRVSNVKHDSVDLVWDKPQHGNVSILNYKVSYSTKQDEVKSVNTTGETLQEKITINELVPNTCYNFKLQSVSKIGVSMESESITAKTAELTTQACMFNTSSHNHLTARLSSAPGQPSIVRVTDTLIELKWSKPQNHPEIVTSYEVFCCRVDDNHIVQKQTNGVIETQIIDELKPETKYTFTVKAICDVGLSYESQTSEITVTKAPLSSAPGQPNIVKVTDTLIELKWSKPQNHPESVTFYEVFCCRVDDNHIVQKQTNGVIETQIIDELKPETKYTFTVKAICDAGLSCESQTSEITVTKVPLSSAPGQPNIVKVTDTLIELKWSKPQNHPESVTFYEVFCCRVDDNHIVQKQTNGVIETQIIDELKPETKYTFTVKAICDAGLSCESQTSEITVTKVPLSSAPGQPNIVKVTDTLIELKWSKPQNHPESVTFYEVFCCRVDDNHIVQKQTNGVIETQIIDELKPETKYSFTVKAICDAGLSYESQTSEITVTKAPLFSAPGQPNIVKVTDTLIELKWSKPQNHPESVTSYEVSCCHVDDNHTSHRQTNGVVETQIVDKLKPETKYSFTVKAICDAGLSCESETSDITVTKAPLSSEPGQPNIVRVTDTLIELKWSKPQNHPESVTSYEVFCCRVDDNHTSHRQTNGVVETQIIDECKPETKYSFTVKAICDAGLSCESETSDITVTKAPLSSAPGQPNIVRVTDTLIELKWSKPQNHPESVTSYEVFCCRVDDNHTSHRQTNGVVETQIINECKPETKYSFTVKAICDAGISCESQISDIIVTKAPLSSEPGKPFVIKKSDTLIELKWKKPEKHPESVIYYEISCTNLDNDEKKDYKTDGANEMKIIDCLQPDICYSFLVKAICAAGSSATSEKKTIQTKPPISSAPGQPFAVDVTDTSIGLKWTKPQSHSENISSYEISCHHVDNNAVDILKTNSAAEVMKFDKLKPETKYRFTVRAKCDAELSPESKTSEIIVTKSSISSAPGDPYAVNITDTSIELKWAKPENHANNVEFYTVYCRSFNDPNDWESYHTNEVNESIVINRLVPKTQYFFKVQAKCTSGKSAESGISNVISTKASVCGRPGKPCAFNATSNSIEVKWTKPEKNHEYVQKYKVFYLPKDDQSENWKSKWTVKTEEYITIDELRPDTFYLFKVQAECNAEFSEESEVSGSVKTKLPLPHAPEQLISSNVRHNSIQLRWRKHWSDSHDDIKSYRVLYRSQPDLTSEWNIYDTKHAEENAIISNLSPKTSYVFKVQAQSLDCQFGDESNEYVTTTNPLICDPPGQPIVDDISHDSVQLRWTKPHNNPEVIQGYIVHYCCLDEPGRPWHSSKVNLVEECLVKGLTPDSNYYFQVQALCKDGASKKSISSHTIKTLIPIPSPPGQPKHLSVTDKSIQLQWARPTWNADFVQNYSVHYRSQNDPPDQWKSIQINGMRESILISELYPKTLYLFRVQAENQRGKSEKSEVSKICTHSALPSQPGQPRAIKVTHNQITLTWAKPAHYAEEVQSYSIFYSIDLPKGKKWAKVETKSVEQVFAVKKLSPNTSYHFKVQAESEDGVSKDSEISDVITTRSPIPSQPGKPKCDSAEHDCLTLSWSKPDHYYENVQYYEVSYYSEDEYHKHQSLPWNIAEKTNGAMETIKIEGLIPEKGYYFKVRAKSEFGDGPESVVSDFIGTKPFRLAVNIVPWCTRIKDSPVTYQVLMKEVLKNDEQKLAKYEFRTMDEFGVLPSIQQQKVLLLVGATGAGKTTLINGMINYLFGVEWKDEFRFKLINEVVQSETKSVTKWITAYSFPKQNGFKFPHSLTIVDTPGFGDTEGIQRDIKITSQIKKFFSTSGIDHLDGVGFVVCSSNVRLTKTQKYIFDSILSVFGNDVKDNIFIMTTFADGGKQPVMESIDAACIPYKEKFKFNNSTLYSPPSNNKFDEMFWDMGIQSFKRFFDCLSQVKPVSTILSQEVLDQREKLQTIIVGLQTQIQVGMSKIDLLRQEQKVLEVNKAKIKANEEFTYVVEELKLHEIELEPGDRATNCLKCNFTCHHPCYIANEKGKFYKCAAMKNLEDENTTCEVCPGECAWQQHRNMPCRLELQRKTVTKQYSDLKERYDKAVEGKTQAESMITNMEKEIQDLFNKILQNIQKAHHCTKCLDEIALKPNPLTDVEYIDLLIESEKLDKKDGFMKRIAYYKEVRKQAELIIKAKGELPKEPSDIWWKNILSLEADTDVPVQFPKKIDPTTVDAPLEDIDDDDVIELD